MSGPSQPGDPGRPLTCRYKGRAVHWSTHVGDEVSEDAIWSYTGPLPECAWKKNSLVFDPEKIASLEAEGELLQFIGRGSAACRSSGCASDRC